MRKDIFFYFKKSVAFFDLKVKSIPPAVFLTMLALYALNTYSVQLAPAADSLSFSQYLAPDGAAAPLRISYPAMFAGLFLMLLINLVSFVYLSAAIREAKNEEYSARDCVNAALRNFLRLTGVTILKNMALLLGLMFFIIPGIYLAIVLIFAECAILDKNSQTLASLKFSQLLTAGKRGDIFKVELFCNLIIVFFVLLLLNFFVTNNVYVFQYAFLFMISICSLIEHKLVAYLYADALAAYEGPAKPAEREAGGDEGREAGSESGNAEMRDDDDAGGGEKRDDDDAENAEKRSGGDRGGE